MRDLVRDNMKQELAIKQYVELCRYDHSGNDGGPPGVLQKFRIWYI
jgi:hypothetical protein